ncbi:Cytoplasmic GTPase/eEF2-like protein (ribosomal biogenesis) [Massospora cicadina]|nr:Cytoplasmic GTPase/eEF2-like protein (ribosomal biogenesis) [Massospora cicadina]
MRRAGNIRNICILAHVDHGKTTLSDSLLASNGIISSKLAGKIRYLDSREDEQLRGITMESSAISLYFGVKTMDKEGILKSNEYLINLIDSPGHVDFSSEVCSASRLCDGALTQMVLIQALREKIQPILVFNKIDRLVTELQMTPLEAYHVNALMAGFFTDELITKDARSHDALKAKRTREEVEAEAAEDVSSKLYDWNLEERDDDEMYFSPEKGNVVFSSAIDGWAFRLQTFASVYAKKLGLKESVFLKCLWGDYYFDPKSKRVLLPKHLKGRNLKPMFVQFVLDNVWAVYDSVLRKTPLIDFSDAEKVQKIITTLNIKVLPRDLRCKDSKVLLSTIHAVAAYIDGGPAFGYRDNPPRLHLNPLASLGFDDLPAPSSPLEHAMFGCDASIEAPIVAYVSKTLYVPNDTLPENRRIQLTAEEMRELGTRARLLRAGPDPITCDEGAPMLAEPIATESKAYGKETLLGVARIFSGTIRVGQKLYALGPKYHPDRPDEHCSEFTVQKLYLFMGRELMSLTEVPAGNVFGIGGLEGHLLKSGTISSTKESRNLGGLQHMVAPILRVALEPSNLGEMPQLIEGLRLLNQSDPCAEVIIQESGEHILVTAGELHLERCLTDLRERFANIEIQVSPPIVPFRETIVGSGATQLEARGFSLGVRLMALPPAVVDFLSTHADSIRTFRAKGHKDTNLDSLHIARSAGSLSLQAFQERLRSLFAETKDSQWDGVVERLWAFGPKRVGPNLLVNRLDYVHPSWFETVASGVTSQQPPWLASRDIAISEFEEGLVMGFQLFAGVGPLCGEPLVGVCCFIDSFTFTEPPDTVRYNPGQFISAMKEACRTSFLLGAPRLMLATYSCDIQATSEVLGRVYSVINRRRGKILSEEMKEGTSFFQIAARLPVVESFNFANEIRTRTSGSAFPQLIFSGFEVLDLDPFWVPTTEEELEDLGEKADRENIAKRYMEAVRRRKGLFVEKKVVESAEKQRTLKK